MDAAVDRGHVQKPVITNPSEWEESYRPLPYLFFGLLIIWIVLVFIWTLNTWTKRRWQTSNLQWVLTSVPILKALVLGLSFVFWYSCLNLSTCSFWVAFGVFVSRIFFETACFIAFLLIAHGYCIMHEQLSTAERRSIAGLASLLYLTLTGYKAAVPQFAVLVVLIYGVMLYVIMVHVARNLAVLREQLQHIQDEGVHMMHTAIYTKYTMFKKFQGAMLMMVVAEILMHARAEGVANEYWMRLLVREWTEIGIFFYIGWTFRSRELTPFFTVIPTLHASGQRVLPPIYSVEMNEKDFNNLDFKEWHIGVPTSLGKGTGGHRSMLVIVQNPGMSSFGYTEDVPSSVLLQEAAYSIPASFQTPSVPSPPTNTPGSDPSSSVAENFVLPRTASQSDCEGLQLRPLLTFVGACGRSSSNVSSMGEHTVGKETDFGAAVKFGEREARVEGKRGFEGGEENTALQVNEVVVDMGKGPKDYSLISFGNSCCDPHPSKHSSLHGRSAMNSELQSLLSHQSSV